LGEKKINLITELVLRQRPLEWKNGVILVPVFTKILKGLCHDTELIIFDVNGWLYVGLKGPLLVFKGTG